jgi:ABC-2 type transport system permease protein
VIFGVIYFALSRTFRMAVINAGKGGSSKVGSGVLKTGTQAQVLLFKEYRRFISSSTYMMNCGLGAIIMVALAVAAVIKRNSITMLLDSAKEIFPNASGIAPAVLTIVIFAIVSTCYYTMPSISLEGKNIWILQTMPIDPMKIFMAKIKMEYILCVPGALILAATVAIITGMSVLTWAAVMIAVLAYITFTAFFGLWINMKRPSFDWTNEAYPIKQGLNPLICLFGEWLLTLILGGIYFFVGAFVPSELYLVVVSAVLFAVSYGIYCWLLTRGRYKFETL